MSGVNEAQKNAANAVKKFWRLIDIYDPADLDPSAVARQYQKNYDSSLEALHDIMDAVAPKSPTGVQLDWDVVSVKAVASDSHHLLDLCALYGGFCIYHVSLYVFLRVFRFNL